MCFVSRLITTKDLSTEQSMLDTIIQSLANTDVDSLSIRDHIEREQAWMDLLNADKLNHLSLDTMLSLAFKSNCYHVAERIYELQHSYGSILTCYLRDKVRQCEVFTYILKNISDSRHSMREQVIDNFIDLVRIDNKRTAQIVTDNFPDDIVRFCGILKTDATLLYSFLGEIVYGEVKIPPDLAEEYLQLMCVKDPSSVYNYVKLNICHLDEALRITQQYGMHLSVAFLLEQSGDFFSALDLLLKNGIVDEAIGVCIRSSEHLDAAGAQQIWLTLLRSPFNVDGVSMRELLHAAAPHVNSTQLLELVTNTNFGDIKVLLKDMLADCQHDKQMLLATLKLMSCDLHQGKCGLKNFDKSGSNVVV